MVEGTLIALMHGMLGWMKGTSLNLQLHTGLAAITSLKSSDVMFLLKLHSTLFNYEAGVEFPLNSQRFKNQVTCYRQNGRFLQLGLTKAKEIGY